MGAEASAETAPEPESDVPATNPDPVDAAPAATAEDRTVEAMTSQTEPERSLQPAAELGLPTFGMEEAVARVPALSVEVQSAEDSLRSPDAPAPSRDPPMAVRFEAGPSPASLPEVPNVSSENLPRPSASQHDQQPPAEPFGRYVPPRRRSAVVGQMVLDAGVLDGSAGPVREARRSRTWYGESQTSGATNFKDDDELAHPAVSVPAEPDPDFSQAGPLTLKTRVEYSAMPKNAMQAVFGLVTVEAAAVESAAQAAPGEADRKPMDLVCVLDVSGSMGSRNKIEDLKAAVRFIINESLPTDRLSLVTFQSSAERRLRLRRMDREGQDEATVATLRMAAGGGTRIASGLDLGLQVLEQRRHRNKVCAILLLTDGQDNSCRTQLPQLLQRASKMGCGIYPFGFGADHDSGLLRELSERAKTPFTYVEETSMVKEAFAGVVGGLSSIVAQRVEVTLNCHARLKEVNTPFEVLRTEASKKAVVSIPDIFAEERRDILVELEVPDDVAKETVLLEASAKYVAVREHAEVRVVTPVVTMTVQRVDEPQPEQEPDEEVFEQRQRWEVTCVMEEASRRSDQGNFEEARQLLRHKRKTLTERRPTRTTQALSTELEDAESRMRNFGTWTMGSHEVRDAMTMHQMQRTTNTIATPSFRGEFKTSKSLYVSSAQSERIRRSTVVGHDDRAAHLAALREGWQKGNGKGGYAHGAATMPAAVAAASAASAAFSAAAAASSAGSSEASGEPAPEQ